MIIMTSYGTQIRMHNAIFRKTLEIYRMAVEYLIDIILAEWDDIEDIDKQKIRYNHIEHLVHKTKKNKPKYGNFDRKFYKLPIYFLRAAIADAYGLVSSYESNKKHNAKAKRLNKRLAKRKLNRLLEKEQEHDT